jgi:hypothetical protein
MNIVSNFFIKKENNGQIFLLPNKFIVFHVSNSNNGIKIDGLRRGEWANIKYSIFKNSTSLWW